MGKCDVLYMCWDVKFFFKFNLKFKVINFYSKKSYDIDLLVVIEIYRGCYF